MHFTFRKKFLQMTFIEVVASGLFRKGKVLCVQRPENARDISL